MRYYNRPISIKIVIITNNLNKAQKPSASTLTTIGSCASYNLIICLHVCMKVQVELIDNSHDEFFIVRLAASISFFF